MPSSVITIDENAFDGCTALKQVTLSENLSVIRRYAFYNCTSLQSLVIPASVQFIYQSAFFNCGLKDMKVLGETPPLTYDDTFSNYSIPLYVPETAVSSYKEANPWCKFTTIEAFEVEAGKCAKPTIVYAKGKLSFSCDTEDVEYHWSITNGTANSGIGNDVDFTQKSTVSVYASKTGYKDSDTATLEIVGSALKGDVNNNGAVDIGDAVTIVNYLVGKTSTLSRSSGVTTEKKEPQ